jgi:hypothetical protein
MEALSRNYHCKDEELPVVAGFLAVSLKRDLKDFNELSPLFDDAYLLKYKDQIETCRAMMPSEEETVALKTITSRLYASIDGLHIQATKLSIYIQLGQADIPVSAADFGITKLFHKIRSKDVEGLLHQLRIVTDNIQIYRMALTQLGMPDTLPAQLGAAVASITSDNMTQYEIVSARRELVQSNMGKMNDLYAIMQEIIRVGRALYRKQNPAKADDYTFTELLKQVRVVHR